MAECYQEYLRRNLLVAKAVGAKANTSHALKRLEQQARPPQWLVNALRGILERVDPLPADLARWRDTAPDVPDYVRDDPSERAEPSDRQWLIRKRGYYYRPDRAGYTASVAEAGRYTEAEAKAEAAIEPSIMQAVPLSDVICPALVDSSPHEWIPVGMADGPIKCRHCGELRT